MTEAMIQSMFAAMRAGLPAGVLHLVIGGKTVSGICGIQNTLQTQTTSGMGDGYSGLVYVLKSELPATPELMSGDVVQLVSGAKRVNKRVRPVGDIGGTILALTLEEEFPA
jgi:hypothetical protein